MLQNERNEYQANCVDKDVKIKSLMKTNLDLQAQIKQLNQNILANENQEQQLETYKRYI